MKNVYICLSLIYSTMFFEQVVISLVMFMFHVFLKSLWRMLKIRRLLRLAHPFLIIKQTRFCGFVILVYMLHEKFEVSSLWAGMRFQCINIACCKFISIFCKKKFFLLFDFSWPIWPIFMLANQSPQFVRPHWCPVVPKCYCIPRLWAQLAPWCPSHPRMYEMNIALKSNVLKSLRIS